MSESKTPRTDAEEKFIYGHIDRKWVTGDFAKSLEQELNAQYEENVHRIAEQAKAENERDQLKAEVELWRLRSAASNEDAVYSRRERDQWREVADKLAARVRVYGNGRFTTNSEALAAYNKLKEGK